MPTGEAPATLGQDAISDPSPPGRRGSTRQRRAAPSRSSRRHAPIRVRRVSDEAPPTASPCALGLAPGFAAMAGAGATIALVAGGRGPLVLVAAMLALAAGRTRVVPVLVAALCAPTIRWGAATVAAVAGDQEVLGPAGWTGDPAGVVSAWAAAVAVVLVATAPGLDGPRLERGFARAVVAVASGLTAAALVAGPGPGGALDVRAVASVLAAAAAVAVMAVRRGQRSSRLLDVIAASSAAVALAAAAYAGA